MLYHYQQMLNSNMNNNQPLALSYQLRCQFLNIKPIIWRCLLLHPHSTLATLHYALQITCNWSDEDNHYFIVRKQRISIPRPFVKVYDLSAEEVSLASLQLQPNEYFLYGYHHVDNWQLEIRIEKQLPLNPKQTYPFCPTGKRAAPPENCGGAERFMQLRNHYSPFYMYHYLLECHELYQRRHELTEPERRELEACQLEIKKFTYWQSIDKFDRHTANRRLKLWVTNDPSWQETKKVVW